MFIYIIYIKYMNYSKIRFKGTFCVVCSFINTLTEKKKNNGCEFCNNDVKRSTRGFFCCCANKVRSIAVSPRYGGYLSKKSTFCSI